MIAKLTEALKRCKAANTPEDMDPADLYLIATSPQHAWMFSADVIPGQRFIMAEGTISSDAYYAYCYAVDIIRGRFEAGEPAIATDPASAYYYATTILGGRFEAGEDAILSDVKLAKRYKKRMVKWSTPRLKYPV